MYIKCLGIFVLYNFSTLGMNLQNVKILNYLLWIIFKVLSGAKHHDPRRMLKMWIH